MRKITFLLASAFSFHCANAHNRLPIPGPRFFDLVDVHLLNADNEFPQIAGEALATYPCSPFSGSNSQRATAFLNEEGYRSGFAQLEKANGPGVDTEFGCLFGIDELTGEMISLPQLNTLSKNSVSIYANPPGIKVTAIAHSHPENVFPAPSAGDFYAFANYAQSHPGFLYYVVAANGTKYVLTVVNGEDLSRFLKNYPQEDHIEPDSLGNAGKGANYKRESEMYDAMQRIATMILSKSANPDNPALADLDKAHEAVQAYMLDHYKTGISLLKQDPDGSFNEIHTLVDEASSRCILISCK